MTPRQLQHVIAGRWDRAGLEQPLMLPWDRVHLARRAMSEADHTFWDDPRDLAAGLQIRVVPFKGRGCGEEFASATVVGFVWCPDRRDRGLRILHGIAHALLLREKWEHSHSDAWLLTLELAAPAHECRALEAGEIAREAHVPSDIVLAWHGMARSIGGLRSVEAA